MLEVGGERVGLWTGRGDGFRLGWGVGLLVGRFVGRSVGRREGGGDDSSVSRIGFNVGAGIRMSTAFPTRSTV